MMLARIDERTARIETCQTEEIVKRRTLSWRVRRLENWRTFLVGAFTVVVAGAEFFREAISRRLDGR